MPVSRISPPDLPIGTRTPKIKLPGLARVAPALAVHPYCSTSAPFSRTARSPPSSPGHTPPPRSGEPFFFPAGGNLSLDHTVDIEDTISTVGVYIMTNFCQLPRWGEILYRCGWTAAASPIGVCRFAVPCVVFQSRCTLRAGEYCISSMAQAAADIAAEREDDCHNKKRWPRFSKRSGARSNRD
jgi:hypothetical protein